MADAAASGEGEGYPITVKPLPAHRKANHLHFLEIEGYSKPQNGTLYEPEPMGTICNSRNPGNAIDQQTE
ncbi:hypothetical protein CDAR_252211 [Caerostris darwini]|uniref:Uncharacterized protein n=1 Tax=Caerostris darwini TaxID=1538125 RepID=A0AAV4Q9S9_9ARAC|nr:hypothetical protein CDAR_252211 [Caerostris darwini]